LLPINHDPVEPRISVPDDSDKKVLRACQPCHLDKVVEQARTSFFTPVVVSLIHRYLQLLICTFEHRVDIANVPLNTEVIFSFDIRKQILVTNLDPSIVLLCFTYLPTMRQAQI